MALDEAIRQKTRAWFVNPRVVCDFDEAASNIYFTLSIAQRSEECFVISHSDYKSVKASDASLVFGESTHMTVEPTGRVVGHVYMSNVHDVWQAIASALSGALKVTGGLLPNAPTRRLMAFLNENPNHLAQPNVVVRGSSYLADEDTILHAVCDRSRHLEACAEHVIRFEHPDISAFFSYMGETWDDVRKDQLPRMGFTHCKLP